MLFAKQFKGSLTIFVINNDGGGIFEHLPISREPEFEKCFARLKIDLSKLCSTFGIKYSLETSWARIIEKIEKPIAAGIEILEIPTNRKKDREIRQKLLSLSPDTDA